MVHEMVWSPIRVVGDYGLALMKTMEATLVLLLPMRAAAHLLPIAQGVGWRSTMLMAERSLCLTGERF